MMRNIVIPAAVVFGFEEVAAPRVKLSEKAVTLILNLKAAMKKEPKGNHKPRLKQLNDYLKALKLPGMNAADVLAFRKPRAAKKADAPTKVSATKKVGAAVPAAVARTVKSWQATVQKTLGKLHAVKLAGNRLTVDFGLVKKTKALTALRYSLADAGYNLKVDPEFAMITRNKGAVKGFYLLVPVKPKLHKSVHKLG